ncbi:MAG: PQQ-dependent sugar dehydrogenase [Bacteroidota bacterium]
MSTFRINIISIYTTLLGLIFFLAGEKKLSAQPLPENFFEETVLDGLNRVIGISFAENGLGFVWEKEGLVHVVEDEQILPQPLIDITEEVADWRDHGLTGLALDPNFLNNGFIYLLYAVDRHHLFNFGTPDYDPEVSITHKPSIGRITRYTCDPATGFRTIIENSRSILLGESYDTGIPILTESHGMGTILFGEDRTLLISVGDAGGGLGPDAGGDEFGAYATQALADGIISEDQDVGAYRAQYLGSLNGKILRIDPDTGEGVSSNPFYDADDPTAPWSRIWALGLRNPYRIMLKPGTGGHTPEEGNPGHLFVGDVGFSNWEELSMVTTGGQNFGWPIYEGYLLNWLYWTNPVAYNQMTPNPLFNNSGCENEFFSFRDLLKNIIETGSPEWVNPCDESMYITPDYRQLHEPPIIVWSNTFWNQPARAMVGAFDENGKLTQIDITDPASGVEGFSFEGFSSIPGVFATEEMFNGTFENALLSADYSGWIHAFHFDENDNLIEVSPFHEDPGNVIHMTYNEIDQCLYFVAYQNKVKRICYGGNPAPIPAFSADPYYGPSPLSVDFSAEETFDPNSENLDFNWSFSQGEAGTGDEISRTFTAPDDDPFAVEVILTVTDDEGASASIQKFISLNNTPPEIEFLSFEDGDYYSNNGTTVLPLIAAVTDLEHSESELSYEWQVFLHHNSHFHAEPIDTTRQTEAIISPTNCQEVYYYRIRLSVTDAGGLTTVKEATLLPVCFPPFFDILEFSGKPVNSNVQLDWSTSFEEEVSHFEVQWSTNTLNFTPVGQVPAGDGNYQFIHENPVIGNNNYRLKIFHNEGYFEYSPIINVKFFSEDDILVFPNPASEAINIGFQDILEEATFTIYDYSGRKMYESIWEGTESAIFTVNISFLKNGVYIYEAKNGITRKRGKLLIIDE